MAGGAALSWALQWLIACTQPVVPDAPTSTPPTPPVEVCAVGSFESPQGCVPCVGAAGVFREQRLVSGAEDRVYLLYVPDSYDCAVAAPVLLDFHGTAGQT